MRKKIQIISMALASLIFVVLLMLNLSTEADTSAAQPATAPAAGSREDPLVTAGYLSKYVSEAIADAMRNIPAATEAADSSETTVSRAVNAGADFEVILLAQNQRIRAASGSLEIIVRPGAEVTVMSGYDDLGIADISTGQEILHGEPAPINHLLVIPRADTRGLVVHSEIAYIMVRGDYIISE